MLDQRYSRADWISLDKIAGLPNNPKDHALDEIVLSMEKYGFAGVVLVNPVTGNLVAGHGRLEGLMWMKAKGKSAPRGIKEQDGAWFVPVWYFPVDADREMGLAIALNRLVETGGWHEDLLTRALADIALGEEGLGGTGFDEDDLDRMIENLSGQKFDEFGEPVSENGDIEQNRYQIIITCDSPAEQQMVLSRLKSQGYRCRVRR